MLQTCPDCNNDYAGRKGQRRNSLRCAACARKRQTSLQKVQQKFRRALKSGLAAKSGCQICGSEKSEAHHDDYAAPLAVRWLCRAHHLQHHVKFGPGLNAFLKETSA